MSTARKNPLNTAPGPTGSPARASCARSMADMSTEHIAGLKAPVTAPATAPGRTAGRSGACPLLASEPGTIAASWP